MVGDEKHRQPGEAFPATPPSNPSLTQAINASTKDLHDSLNALVMQRFTLGLRDYRLYREGIRSFYHIYDAFEHTWATLRLPTAAVPPHVAAALQALADPRLDRAPAISLDLNYLYGDEAPAAAWAADCSPDTPERIACVAHIERTLREKPHVLLAYAHIYYMALFAGGKILLRQIRAASDFLPVRPPAATHADAVWYATNMFCFPSLPCKGEDPLRTRFKEAMAIAEEGLSEEEKTGHNRGGTHNLQAE